MARFDMNSLRKVLFYNWAPAFDAEKQGSGVSVYQNNCISLLLNRGWRVHSLSAGIAYDLTRSDPYITKTEESKNSHVSFSMVNSPLTAPAFYSFFINEVTSGKSSDRAVADAMINFIRINGPYDVFHLNNLEGLPAAVLPILRQEFRDMRFVFFLHNYYPMCPQVNLWKNDSINCDGKEGGKACCSCLGKNYTVRASNVVSDRAISDTIFGSRVQPKRTFARRLVRKGLRIGKGPQFLSFMRRRIGSPLSFESENELHSEDLLPYFRDRERDLIQIINQSFDVILCVSHRVRDISVTAGISAEKCKTSYPGTMFYQTPLPVHKPRSDTPLKLAFLGFANHKIKGLDFLLSTLEQCPDALLSKVDMLIAAKSIYQDPRNRTRLSALGSKLGGLTVRDGYSHPELGALLADVDLGVLPHLWEDCYPQVALEFVCNGVPIIVSNLGGSREVSSNPDFEFDAGSHADLIKVIEKFANDKQKILSFWSKEPSICSMDAHLDELLEYYSDRSAEVRTS
jgi:glycosyltransferase involved in cell wall biosynthesis